MKEELVSTQELLRLIDAHNRECDKTLTRLNYDDLGLDVCLECDLVRYTNTASEWTYDDMSSWGELRTKERERDGRNG